MEANSIAIWLNTVFANFDLAVTQFIQNLFGPYREFFTPFFEAVSFVAHDGIPLILIGFLLCFNRKTRKYGTAMLLALAVGAIITNVFLKNLVARPRPYSVDGSYYQEMWKLVGMNTESDNSFPSGHTTAGFAAAIALYHVATKKTIGWFVFPFAILLGISRIYLCVHYPTDVIAGAVSGTIGGFGGTYLADKLPERHFGGVPFRYTQFIDVAAKAFIQDPEHHYDYKNSEKISRFGFGQLGLYWKDLSKKFFCEYSYIDKVTCSVVECSEDEFAQKYSYYRIFLYHDGSPFANLIVNKESEADQILEKIREKSDIAA